MHRPGWQLSSEARQRFCRDGFCVIDPCLAADALQAFEAECAALSHGVDLDETDCVVDLWASHALDDHHPARVDPAVYKRLRAHVVASSEGSLADNQVVVSTILGQLASLAAQAFSSIVQGPVDGKIDTGVQDTEAELDTRLFNEHYVVKPADSSMEFGWHTDQNEQLQMCLNQPVLPYISVWLPLCNTAEDNGTLEILPRSAPQPPRDADKSHPFFLSLASEVEEEEKEEFIHNDQIANVEACMQGFVVDRNDRSEPGDNDASAALIEGIGDEKRIVSNVPTPVMCKRIKMRAGGAVLFASDLWHRSGPNRSSTPRQVFYAQFTCGVLRSDGTLGPSYRAPGLTQEHGGVGSNGGGDDSDVSRGQGGPRKCRRLTEPLAFAVPAFAVSAQNVADSGRL